MPTPLEQYQRFREELQPEMYQRRLDLSNWLVKQTLYKEAAHELTTLLRDKPDMHDARRVLDIVQAQLALEQQFASPENTTNVGEINTSTDTSNTGPVNQADLLPKELISEADVNLIRVFEIDFRNPPNVSVSPATIRSLIANHASHEAIPTGNDQRNRLFRAAPIDVARLIFNVKARELYGEINVLQEPYALNLYRQRVHNMWLIKNCATSACHGGVNAGRFFLHNRNHQNERVAFTNLLILERSELDPDHPLINYEEPLMSRIIQHGLPVAEARDPHPQVRGWKPIFQRANRRMLEDALRWIDAMYVPRPDYPIEYEPPQLVDNTIDPVEAATTGATGETERADR